MPSFPRRWFLLEISFLFSSIVLYFKRKLQVLTERGKWCKWREGMYHTLEGQHQLALQVYCRLDFHSLIHIPFLVFCIQSFCQYLSIMFKISKISSPIFLRMLIFITEFYNRTSWGIYSIFIQFGIFLWKCFFLKTWWYLVSVDLVLKFSGHLPVISHVLGSHESGLEKPYWRSRFTPTFITLGVCGSSHPLPLSKELFWDCFQH